MYIFLFRILQNNMRDVIIKNEQQTLNFRFHGGYFVVSEFLQRFRQKKINQFYELHSTHIHIRIHQKEWSSIQYSVYLKICNKKHSNISIICRFFCFGSFLCWFWFAIHPFDCLDFVSFLFGAACVYIFRTFAWFFCAVCTNSTTIGRNAINKSANPMDGMMCRYYIHEVFIVTLDFHVIPREKKNNENTYTEWSVHCALYEVSIIDETNAIQFNWDRFVIFPTLYFNGRIRNVIRSRKKNEQQNVDFYLILRLFYFPAKPMGRKPVLQSAENSFQKLTLICLSLKKMWISADFFFLEG